MNGDPARIEELLGLSQNAALDLRKHVADWIKKCLTVDHGLPMFRTQYAGRPFKRDNEYLVLGICYSGPDTVKSRWFRNVPPEDFAHLTSYHDDYRYLLQKYGKPPSLPAV